MKRRNERGRATGFDGREAAYKHAKSRAVLYRALGSIVRIDRATLCRCADHHREHYFDDYWYY